MEKAEGRYLPSPLIPHASTRSCYTNFMESDEKATSEEDNSRENDSNEDFEMYTPEPDKDDIAEKKNNKHANHKKPDIDDEPVRWVASEYIHQEKNWLWFVIFAVVAVGLIVAGAMLLKSYTFPVLVVVMTAAVIVYSRRPPHQIEYTLSGDQGLYVGEKLYHFNEFKAFGLIRDGEHNSITLIPIKRFAPGVSVYFPTEVGEEVIDILGARLPMQEIKPDGIDIIVRKLRL